CPYTGYNSSQCMYFPANCGQTSNISGERQQVYTAVYNFSTAPHPALWFDVAYEPSHVPAYSDTLVVSYSSDCGSTWHILYTKGGMTLCTTGSTTGAGTDTAGSHGHGCFIPPNTAAWRTDSVNIAVVTGKPSVMFSFESRSGWGNILYLDNINITDNLTTGIVEHYLTRDVRVYPNPNNGSFNIALTGKAHVWVYNLLGQPVFDSPLVSGANSISLESGAGIYFYSIRSENGKERISEGKVIVQ
ncbi:MAG TPA: T9SS type A sorting domain-containing protein, partial [Bacteroidia bacterium]|nr:T9SS type A sorting domain-containing protein [Bacteroidia bacterium]